MRYPYLVVRIMPAVYIRREIRFTNGDSERYQPCRSIKDPLWVDASHDDTDELDPASRRELLRAAQRESQRLDLRLCVLLSPGSCVYVEPDGKLELSDTPPSMRVG